MSSGIELPNVPFLRCHPRKSVTVSDCLCSSLGIPHRSLAGHSKSKSLNIDETLRADDGRRTTSRLWFVSVRIGGLPGPPGSPSSTLTSRVSRVCFHQDVSCGPVGQRKKNEIYTPTCIYTHAQPLYFLSSDSLRRVVALVVPIVTGYQRMIMMSIDTHNESIL